MNPERDREGTSRTKQDAEHVRGFVRDTQRAPVSYGMNDENLNKKELYDLQKEAKQKEAGRIQRKKTARRGVFWLLTVVVLVGAVWGMIKLAGRSGQQTPLSIGSVSESDWTRGSKEARAVLIEYGDFQCPACGAYFPIVKRLEEEFGADLQFVYRHFPLRQIHKNAQLAAQAAEAAGKQSKFWEMHDKLFENQPAWSNSSDAESLFIQYAQSLGLNIDQFKDDLDLNAVEDKVKNDYASGADVGVNSTPTFFLNGKQIKPKDYDEFRNLISQAVSGS